jgi:inhibitor of KinA
MDEVRFFSLGDSALTVEFGNTISIELNRKCVGLAEKLTREPFAGFVEAVPAYASISIYYDLVEVRRCFPEFSSAFCAVKSFTEHLLENLSVSNEETSRLVEIPTYFDADTGPDLEIVSEQSRLSVDSVIELFTGTIYRVFMLGFLPGFSYMGEVDERIATPRKKTPRAYVAKGSVGIAGRQTGIYSLDSPGGWQIIGRTDLELFTPYTETPCLLRAGDRVRFVRVGQ